MAPLHRYIYNPYAPEQIDTHRPGTVNRLIPLLPSPRYIYHHTGVPQIASIATAVTAAAVTIILAFIYIEIFVYV